MGRYINWNDVLARYDQASDIGDAAHVSSVYIAYAESLVDASLADVYTVPFSDNNIMIKDVCVDLAFARSQRGDLEESSRVHSMAMTMLAGLKDGTLTMVDVNGNVIEQTVRAGAAYSTTQSYAPTFGYSDPIDWELSRNRLEDEDFSRGD